MSFGIDEMRKFEDAAEVAMTQKDYVNAYVNMTRAAIIATQISDSKKGEDGRRYTDHAAELIDIAEKIKSKVQEETPELIPEKPAEKPSESGQASPWVMDEKPDVKLMDVAGLDEVKEQLNEKVILKFKYPKEWEQWKLESGGGVLMYGPPGNGKTYIAKAIAGELDAVFFNVDFSDIKDKYVGESEKNIKALFDEARKYPKVVIFMDEINHLLSKYGNKKLGILEQFLVQMDGIKENKNSLLVLGATNKPWELDEAVTRPRRLETLIYVGLPDERARKAIFARELGRVNTDPSIDYEAIAKASDKYSGADIWYICNQAKLSAFMKQISGKEEVRITTAEVLTMIVQTRPSVTQAMVDKFRLWEENPSDPSFSVDQDD